MKRLDPIKLKQNIESRIGDDIAAGRVGCASVVVRQNGRLLYENQFGFSDLCKTPLAKNAIFRMASMTKPITAVAVLALKEEGKLSLDDRVDRYLPEYRNLWLVEERDGGLVRTSRVQTPPTVRHLLTHTSGIGGGAIGAKQLRMMNDAQSGELRKAVSYYAEAGLQFEPGSAVLYSGVPGFDVAAAIVEQIADCPFESFLKERIFAPCNMIDTTFAPRDEQWARMVTMHDYADGKAFVGKTVPGCVFEDIPASHALGGAGLISTIGDYGNFAEMLQAGGVFEGARVLSEELVREMATPWVSFALQPKPKRWGLSVKVVTDESYARLPVGCYGWSGAYGTHFWVDPENHITAIYMKNSQYDGGGDAVTNLHFEEDVTASFIGEDL